MKINSIGRQSFGKLYASEKDITKHLLSLPLQDREKAVLAINRIKDSDKIVVYLNGDKVDLYNLKVNYNIGKGAAGKASDDFLDILERIEKRERNVKCVANLNFDQDTPYYTLYD